MDAGDKAEQHILVVGAGPVGLITAVLLARQGLRSIIVERYQTRHGAPKAHALNPRSLEILRSVGLDIEAMKQRATRAQDGGWVRFVTTLSGVEIGSLPYERQDDAVLELTPTPLINLSQPMFEDFLLAAVEQSPLIELRRGLNWLSCDEREDLVASTVEDSETGARTILVTRYLIAADGAGSAVRANLNIPMIGDSKPQPFITIHFRANLRRLVQDRPAILYWIMQPPHVGVLIAYDIDSTWCLLYPHDPELMPRESFTPGVCLYILHHVIGATHEPIEIKNILPWVMVSEVADGYRKGRVFLVGDAAHRFPPTGGLGLNTGLQDAHNLAWKIAAVEKFGAPETLLDTYQSERRAVALANAEQSYKNAERILSLQASLKADVDDPEAVAKRLKDPAAHWEINAQISNQREHFDSLALQLGFRYGADRENIRNVSDFRPRLQVGGRFPHAWVERDSRVISSLDLLDNHAFTVLVGPQHERTLRLANTNVPLRIVVENADFQDPRANLRKFVDLAAGDAVVVRPDGHVATVFRGIDGHKLSEAVLSSLKNVLSGEVTR